MEYKLRETNTSRKYYTESVWQSNNCGTFKILGQVDRFRQAKDGKYFEYFRVEFEDGTIVDTRMSKIKTGEIRNPNFKSVLGVGYMGQGVHSSSQNSKTTKEYCIWAHMMGRCYNPKSKEDHPSYDDCFVDSRWHNFQNFCEDIPFLPGYEEWALSVCEMHLDKDIKVPGNKIYSKDTCMFIYASENTRFASFDIPKTGKTYIGTNINTGKEEVFYSLSKFARKHDLISSHVGSCCRGQRKSHKGWRFKIVDDNES